MIVELVEVMGEGERLESIPITLVEFVLELHPMKSQGVQKTLHGVHAHQHPSCNPAQHVKGYNHLHRGKITPGIMISIDLVSRAFCNVFSKKTLASWECARERAQRRRYEAVLETAPRTNSIVSIN